MERSGDSQNRVAPLTHPDLQRPGNPYRRLDRVEAQITELLRLDKSELVNRANESDFKASTYIHSESIVYFIREALRAGDDNLINILTSILSKRCAKHINDKTQKLIDYRYRDDCFNDAITAIFGPILDLSGDQGDFAQVRFGVFLKYGVNNIIREYLNRQRDDRMTASLDTEVKDSDNVPFTPDDLHQGVNGIFNRVALNEIISTLDEPHRTAFLMRHMGGWEIENKDPKVFTISKHFKCASRTVRRWLDEAEEQLRLQWGD